MAAADAEAEGSDFQCSNGFWFAHPELAAAPAAES